MTTPTQPVPEEPRIERGTAPTVESHTEQTVGDVSRSKCCVVGGGPAGMILAYLLARQNVPVILLEAHHDFDRKFRGDTVHPAVLELLDKLGLAERLHQLPHTRVYSPTVQTVDGSLKITDLRWLKIKYPYIMLLPQVEFLNFLAAEAKKLPAFELRTGANVQQLVEEEGRVKGVRYRTAEGWHEVRADLTVGADGRFSRLRHLLGVEPVKSAPPMDVIWFELPLTPGGPQFEGLNFILGAGRSLVVFNRNDHYQVAYVFAKGKYQELKAAGLDAFRRSLVELVPGLAPAAEKLRGWQDLILLSVESSCCERWYKDGALLIGDAAHVMSPVMGVGINYAIQDAVEASNILAGPLRRGTLTTDDLRKVQERRLWVVKRVQAIQAMAQKRMVATLKADRPPKLPWIVKLIPKIPLVRTIPARFLAYGIGRPRVKLLKG